MEKHDSTEKKEEKLGGIRRSWTQFALMIGALIVIALIIFFVVVPIVK